MIFPGGVPRKRDSRGDGSSQVREPLTVAARYGNRAVTVRERFLKVGCGLVAAAESEDAVVAAVVLRRVQIEPVTRNGALVIYRRSVFHRLEMDLVS
jgi:hypothetical protein